MKKKIAFLSTTHTPFDDRIFYHQAQSLVRFNHEVCIISSKYEADINISGIHIMSFDDTPLSKKIKIAEFNDRLTRFNPNIIVCDTPLSIWAAMKYRKKTNKKNIKIISDITEWYPSKKNLRNTPIFKQIFLFVSLALFNLLSNIHADSFIFGEYYKSIPFRLIFFWKPYLYLSYYPDIKYIKTYPRSTINEQCILFYSGNFTQEKGFYNFLESAKKCGILKPNVKFILKLIGKFPHVKDQEFFNSFINSLTQNIHIQHSEYLKFEKFCEVIGQADVFFDLRSNDFENTHCLPIKLFYYAATGRPVIYSNLKSIKKEIANLDFGYLVEPGNTDLIARIICNYIDHPDLYEKHCKKALECSLSKYNWQRIEKSFIDFTTN